MKYQCGVGGSFVSHTTNVIILWLEGHHNMRNCLKTVGKLRITFKLEINYQSITICCKEFCRNKLICFHLNYLKVLE